jgi:hypothetical protein
VLVLAPVVAVCVSVIGRHWHPGGDQALEMLRIEDVATSHTPLLGAWSRWGWAHPGPALFWALSPFYRVFGETGVPIGMGVLNGAAIVGVVLVAHRRGGTELAALAGLVMALLIRSLGVSLLVDIWNPWAAFLPFVLFVMLAWAVLCRDWAMLPIAVFVGATGRRQATFAITGSVGSSPHGPTGVVARPARRGTAFGRGCGLGRVSGDRHVEAHRRCRLLFDAVVVGGGCDRQPRCRLGADQCLR